MNNYERIKQMSIDEMARLLTDSCELRFNCNDFICGDENCIKSMKQWLQSESEE